ncbi:hypothetical protein FBQ97_09865 [Acidobacteria bacterium ACD]|nr:MAG: hypothetical protein EDX89_10760 [Acidobacteriota bacterium]MDL1950103.1 hypothetical protein [Acidobacteria bacterium ACD]
MANTWALPASVLLAPVAALLGCMPAVSPGRSPGATLPATAPVCRPGGRLLVEVKPAALYVHPAVEVDLAARFPPPATGFGLAGFKARDPADTPSGEDLEDPNPRLTRAAEKALGGEGLDVRLLGAIDGAARRRSRCEVVVFSVPPSGLVPSAADDVYVVEADLLFGGRPAEVLARLAWSHLKDATALPAFEDSVARCRHLGEMGSHGVVVNVSQVKRGMAACEAVESAFDAFDSVRVDLPGRPMEEWLERDAEALRLELDEALPRMAALMADRLLGPPPAD